MSAKVSFSVLGAHIKTGPELQGYDVRLTYEKHTIHSKGQIAFCEGSLACINLSYHSIYAYTITQGISKIVEISK